MSNSDNEPLNIITIAEVPTREKNGAKLLISEAPGRKYKGVSRSLTADLETILNNNVKVIVCLLEWSELDKLKMKNYPNRAQERNLIFYHFPMRGGSMSTFKESYSITSCIISHLSQGDNVLVHCREGLCRSAIICACCLAHYSFNSYNAIKEVRWRRKGAIKNCQQEDCVHSYWNNIKRKCQQI